LQPIKDNAGYNLKEKKNPYKTNCNWITNVHIFYIVNAN